MRLSHITSSISSKPLQTRSILITLLAAIGLILVCAIPPFQSPDEQTHLYRAYQISEGRLVAKKLSYGVGGNLPSSLSESFNSYSHLLFNKDAKVTSQVAHAAWAKPLNPAVRSETRFENTATYPFVAYIPQSLGVLVGRLCNFGPIQLLYIARIFNLAAWLAILWLAMKRAPRLTAPLFAFALIPIAAFQAASVSADVVTGGLAVLFSVEIFRILTEDKVLSRRSQIYLFCIAALLALCKFPYVLLTGLVFFIPRSRFADSKKIYLLKIFGCCFGAIALSFLWLLVTRGTYENLREIANAPQQLHFVASHPLSYLKTLYMTYIALPSDALFSQVGILGWLDAPVPLWTIVTTYCATLLSIASIPFKATNYSTFKRIGIAMVGICIIGIISSLLYVTWNAPRAGVIEGLQARYYMPLFGIVILVGAGWLGLSQTQTRRSNILVYSLSGLSAIALLATIYNRYY